MNDHDLLLRIDERTAAMQSDITEMKGVLGQHIRDDREDFARVDREMKEVDGRVSTMRRRVAYFAGGATIFLGAVEAWARGLFDRF